MLSHSLSIYIEKGFHVLLGHHDVALARHECNTKVFRSVYLAHIMYIVLTNPGSCDEIFVMTKMHAESIHNFCRKVHV